MVDKLRLFGIISLSTPLFSSNSVECVTVPWECVIQSVHHMLSNSLVYSVNVTPIAHTCEVLKVIEA